VVELCNRQAVQIAITMYPHRQQIKPDEGGVLWHREFERRVEQLCREQGVSFFSAYDGLSRAFNEGQPIYREKDIHFTNLGHRLWADLISDHFINLLDDKTIGRQLQR
jgi:lysophospholipase L1-like esterase